MFRLIGALLEFIGEGIVVIIELIVLNYLTKVPKYKKILFPFIISSQYNNLPF